jgi:DNA-binding transcriptional MerR regulator
MGYPAKFKAEILSKMSGPYSRTARELSRETGVHYTTLSQWKRESGKIVHMSKRKIKNQKRPTAKTPEEKLDLVLKAKQLTNEELGEFLRSNGIHEADLKKWQEEALAGIGGWQQKQRQSSDAKRVRELEKELRRKDKALAETAALLVLQKKVREIWGDGDDDTTPRNGR